jgi:hypothetical protein
MSAKMGGRPAESSQRTWTGWPRPGMKCRNASAGTATRIASFRAVVRKQRIQYLPPISTDERR